MGLIILLVLGIFVFYISQVVKYRRPNYYLTYVIGKKGSGKSCYLAKEIKRHLKDGWHCYTTNKELVTQNVIYCPFECLGKFAFPQKSVLFWDEASLNVYNRNYKNFDTNIRDWLVYMRHYGNSVYIVSQSYNIDKAIKDLVDNILLLSSPIPLITTIQKVSRKIVTVTSADGESKISEQLIIQGLFGAKKLYQPKYYKLYDSFSAIDDLPVLPVDTDPVLFLSSGEKGAE